MISKIIFGICLTLGVSGFAQAQAKLQAPEQFSDVDLNQAVSEAEDWGEEVRVKYQDGKILINMEEINEIAEEGTKIFELGADYYNRLKSGAALIIDENIGEAVVFDPADENLFKLGDSFVRLKENIFPEVKLLLRDYAVDELLLNKRGEKIEIISDGSAASTDESLLYEQGKIWLFDAQSQEKYLLEMLPSEIRQLVQGENGEIKIQNIEIKNEGGEPLYEVKGLDTKKILGIFPLKLNVAIEISADGKTIGYQQEKHWWDFLLF